MARTERDDVSNQRVLANEAATDEESIEDMVRRLERELDKEFAGFEARKNPCPATSAIAAAAEAPEKTVPEAAAELEALKVENKKFNNSFVEVGVESAMKILAAEAATEAPGTRVPATPPTIVQSQPPETSNRWKMEEATKKQSPDGSWQQKTPEKEYDRRPPRAQDKSHMHQVQGCLQHLTVSRKGVLDIGYLASGRGPECRSRYRFGAEARVREVHAWLARNRRQ